MHPSGTEKAKTALLEQRPVPFYDVFGASIIN